MTIRPNSKSAHSARAICGAVNASTIMIIGILKSVKSAKQDIGFFRLLGLPGTIRIRASGIPHARGSEGWSPPVGGAPEAAEAPARAAGAVVEVGIGGIA